MDQSIIFEEHLLWPFYFFFYHFPFFLLMNLNQDLKGKCGHKTTQETWRATWSLLPNNSFFFDKLYHFLFFRYFEFKRDECTHLVLEWGKESWCIEFRTDRRANIKTNESFKIIPISLSFFSLLIWYNWVQGCVLDGQERRLLELVSTFDWCQGLLYFIIYFLKYFNLLIYFTFESQFRKFIPI